jgi:hypothetical protein
MARSDLDSARKRRCEKIAAWMTKRIKFKKKKSNPSAMNVCVGENAQLR